MAASKKKTKTIPLPKGKPAPAKKEKKTPAKKRSNVTAKPARGNTRAVPVAKRAVRKKKSLADTFAENLAKHPVVKPAWKVELIFGNDTGVYCLANDQRVYRWNTRSAVWVLHKEGLAA